MGCIGKGKDHTPYEFRSKATVTTTNGRAKGGRLILHAYALHGNSLHGHAWGEALKQMVALTGIIPKQAYLDEEYGGDKQSMHTPDPKSELPTRPSWPVFISK